MIKPSAYIWTFVGRVLPLIVQFVTMMILSRILSPIDFGQIGVLTIFISVANTLNESGFGGSIIKEKSLSKIDISTVFVYNTVVSISLYIILFVCSNQIEIYFNSEGLSKIAKLIGLVFVFNAFGMVPRALLFKKLKFKVIAVANFIGVLLSSLIGIFMACLNEGVYSLVIYQIAQALIISLCLIKSSSFTFSFSFSKKSFKKLFSFGFFTSCCSVVDSVYENSLSFLFGKYLNITQAGYISQAKRMEEISTTSIAQTINTASFPILTKIDNTERFVSEVKSLLKIVPSLLFPVLMLIPLFSEQIIVLALGEKWKSASPYLSVLTYAGLFMILETLSRNFIKALGEVSSLLKITIIKRLIGLALIITTLIVYKEYILWSYVLGAAIGLFLNLYLLASLTEIKIIAYIGYIIKYSLIPILYLVSCNGIFLLIHPIIVRILFCIGLLIVSYLITIKTLGLKLSGIKKMIK